MTDSLLEPKSNSTPDDVDHADNPSERGPEGVEAEEWLGLTPPELICVCRF